MTTETTPVAGQATPEAGVQQTADGVTPKVEAADPADTSQTGDKPAGDAPKADAVEPVYEFKAPDGVELDKPSTDEFVALAKEAKLSPEVAQKVVDIAIKREQARTEAFAKEVQGWENTVKTDKELGGDKLDETLAICRKAIDLGPPELKDLLSSSKMGSHPAVVKWAYAVGKALSEDRYVAGGGGAPKGDKGAAQVLYPNQS